MISTLLPAGAAALVTVVTEALREFEPGGFLRALLDGHEAAGPATSSPLAGATEGKSEQLDISRALPALAEALRVRFRAAGVDLTQPIVLKEDGQGGVITDGDHRDRAVIEQLLAGDARLREEFLAVAQAATAERGQIESLWGFSQREFRLRIERDLATIQFD